MRDLAGLEARLTLTDDERRGVERALAGGFPLAITPYYLDLVDAEDPTCPIRRQVVPSAREAERVPGDLRDPLGEESHEVAPELVQRYPDRALLLASDRCAVYCRFCTRSRMVGDGGGARSMDRLVPAFAYLEAHPAIREVIVSGGDPAVMATARLARILERLAAIPHLDTVRLATRAPVTIPQRINEEFATMLAQ
ncbi:MAG: radical SAM protein, partial [Myxococcota bacterium]